MLLKVIINLNSKMTKNCQNCSRDFEEERKDKHHLFCPNCRGKEYADDAEELADEFKGLTFDKAPSSYN